MPRATRKKAAGRPTGSGSNSLHAINAANPSKPSERDHNPVNEQSKTDETEKTQEQGVELAQGDGNEAPRRATRSSRKHADEKQDEEIQNEGPDEPKKSNKAKAKPTTRKAAALKKKPVSKKGPAPKAVPKTLPRTANQDSTSVTAHESSVPTIQSGRKRGNDDDEDDEVLDDRDACDPSQKETGTRKPAAKRPRKAPQTRASRKPSVQAQPKPKPKPVPKSKSKRRAGNDDEDGDEDDQDNQSSDDSDGNSSDDDNGNATGKRPRQSKPKICDFCATHPVGMEMAKTRPCDWEDKRKLECMNCANFRHDHPDSGGWDHACHIRGQSKTLHRRYADNAPDGYTGDACERCVEDNLAAKCDVDTTLGYGCQHCVGKDKDKNEKVCVVNGNIWQRRPNVRQAVDKWFRHPCDTCLFATKTRKNQAGCSWLSDRKSWTTRCTRCVTITMSCWDGGELVGHPAATDVVLPLKWSVTFELNGGWSELRGITPWRKNCQNCGLQSGSQSHCRALARSAMFACNLCLSFGLDCRTEDGHLWPLFDLSRVGFGNSSAFPACARCVEKKRNCDRQRPCDSCVHNGEGDKCDAYVKEPASKKKLGPSFKNCIKGRVKTGPLYYLSLGYGAGGVDDVKDGSRLEHWAGPAIAMYAMAGGRDDNNNGIQANSNKLRKALLPPLQPPHGGPGGHLSSKAPSEMSVDDLVKMILDQWPGAFPLNQHPAYVAEIDRARHQRQLLAVGEGRGRARAPARNVADPVVEEEEEEGEAEEGGSENEEAEHDNHGNAPALGVPDIGAQDAESDRDASGESVNDEQDAQGHIGPSRPQAERSPTRSPPEGVDEASGSSSLGFPNEAGELLNQVCEMADNSLPDSSVDDPSFGTDIYWPQQQAEAHSQVQQQSIQESPAAQRALSRWTTFCSQEVPTSLGQRTSDENMLSTGAPVERRLFTVSCDEIPLISPILPANKLAKFEIPDMEHQFTRVVEDPEELAHCQDPSSNGGNCNLIVQPHQACKCTDHSGVSTEPFHVCDDCAQLSSDMLVDQRVMPITAAEILGMRAYLCGDCAAIYSQDTGSIEQLRLNGATRVWGSTFNNGLEVAGTLAINGEDMSFHQRARPATGCPCGSKIFRTRLCRAHRFIHAQQALSAVEEVREWRRGTFGNDLCPGCLLSKTRDECNLSSAEPGGADGPKAWICMQCNDAVINQPNRGLVDGWQTWFSGPPPRDWLEETEGACANADGDMFESLYDNA